MEKDGINSFGAYLELITNRNPVVHQITNFVTANDCANAVLAMGGRTVMADYIEEIEEITGAADSLVLNLGVPSEERFQSLLLAGKAANKKRIPVVFDPVGCGASSFRRNAAKELLHEVEVSVIRGNSSEIQCLFDKYNRMRGIDAETEFDSICTVRKFAKKTHAVVVITGERDIVTDGDRMYMIENGCKEMSLLTGTGCICSALTGLFLGADTKAVYSAVCAAACVGIAGELSWKRYGECGLGHFHMGLFDMLGNMRKEIFEAEARIHEI